MPIMFSRDFMGDPARAEERRHWQQKLTRNRRSIWRAVNGVIDRQGVHDELPRIACPVLVMVGEQDTATVPAKAERIHAAIRSEEHTSELQSLMRISYAVFCLKKNNREKKNDSDVMRSE